MGEDPKLAPRRADMTHWSLITIAVAGSGVSAAYTSLRAGEGLGTSQREGHGADVGKDTRRCHGVCDTLSQCHVTHVRHRRYQAQIIQIVRVTR